MLYSSLDRGTPSSWFPNPQDARAELSERAAAQPEEAYGGECDTDTGGAVEGFEKSEGLWDHLAFVRQRKVV